MRISYVPFKHVKAKPLVNNSPTDTNTSPQTDDRMIFKLRSQPLAKALIVVENADTAMKTASLDFTKQTS